MTAAGPPARVRLVRAPLGADPTLEAVIEAVDGLAMPFVLVGRWGLPTGASPQARVVVAGAVPSRVGSTGDPEADPFAVFDDRPELVGDAPAGTIGGGWFGWLSYDLGRNVEPTLGPQPWRPKPLEPVRMAWYDDVLRRDEAGVWWVEALIPSGRATTEAIQASLARWQGRLAVGQALRRGADEAPVTRLGAMRIHRGAAAHRAAVAEAVERIFAGEIFQANVCLRLEGALAATGGSARAAGLAARVLTATDPRFGAWIAGRDDTAIVSASPELFLQRRGRAVKTGPIKGTAPRDVHVAMDLQGAAGASGPARDAEPQSDPAALALLGSEKDRAEHVMILDLMRNDFGRVCDYGSVRYQAQPRLEPHAGVWHLVSEVNGLLHEGVGDARLLRATFPPGSVTGAPKVQAMRVIAAVEGTGREIYTGAHGFLSPVAGLELAVTIRTIETSGQQAWIGAGGGIVADSDPEAELAEALTKARALIAAAGGTVVEPNGTQAGLPAARVAVIRWAASSSRRPDPLGGLVETISVRDGRGGHVDEHLQRLEVSARALGYGCLPNDLRRQVIELATTATGPARLRLLARTGDGSAAGPAFGAANTEVVARIELQLLPVRIDPAVAIDLAPAIVPGGLGPHKWLDRLIVDQLTTCLGATPLLLDADGVVLEAGWANVWWLDGDTFCTPPTDGRILPGVTRAAMLTAAAAAGTPAIQQRSATLAEIAERPLLLTSARGLSVARLLGSAPETAQEAVAAAARLAPLLQARR